MHVILNGEPLEEADCFKYLWSQVAAGPDKWRIGDRGQEVSIRRSNCTNGVVRSRGMGYEKCSEKESECSGDEVLDKFGWSVLKG